MNSRTKTISKLLIAAVTVALFVLISNADAFRKGRAVRQENYTQTEEQMERLRRLMLPLLRVSSLKTGGNGISVSIIDDPAVNAASAGSGQFYVTTGLLNQATDDQLRGVLAHEIAHEDLGHPAKAQVVGVGVGLGVALLEQIIPGSSAITPIAGTLISGNYTRPLELQADRHAVTLLQRAGYAKESMADTLAWLVRINGDHGGGILSTHPATSERIQALRSIR